MKQLAVLTFALSALAWPAAHSEQSYYLERCVVNGKKLNLSFVGSSSRVRRFHLSPAGVELSGDIKGSTKLENVLELRLEPKFKVVYVSGRSAEFGALTAQCSQKLRAVGKQLSVVVLGSER